MNAPGRVTTPAPLDTLALRHALGRFATGVTIVTCVDAAGQPQGLTVNSFNALSLEPPLVLWALRQVSHLMEAFCGASHFAVNVLAQAQQPVAARFASPVANRFALGQWQAGLGGAPVLAGCTAVFECAAHSHHVVGDHQLFVGRVLRFGHVDCPPLLFHGGRYQALVS